MEFLVALVYSEYQLIVEGVWSCLVLLPSISLATSHSTTANIHTNISTELKPYQNIFLYTRSTFLKCWMPSDCGGLAIYSSNWHPAKRASKRWWNHLVFNIHKQLLKIAMHEWYQLNNTGMHPSIVANPLVQVVLHAHVIEENMQSCKRCCVFLETDCTSAITNTKQRLRNHSTK